MHDPAITQILITVDPVITSVCRDRVPPDDAPDVAQETRVTLWLDLRRAEVLPEEPKVWARRSARWRCSEYWRRCGRDRSRLVERMPDAVSREPGPEPSVIAREVWAAMTGELPESHREVLFWRLVADLPVDRVAQLLGRSPVAVRQSQFRAVRTLRANLAGVAA